MCCVCVQVELEPLETPPPPVLLLLAEWLLDKFSCGGGKQQETKPGPGRERH